MIHLSVRAYVLAGGRVLLGDMEDALFDHALQRFYRNLHVRIRFGVPCAIF